MNANPELLSFYLGSVDDNRRLYVEQELLTDPAVLLDYLDLKRELEGATPVPSTPSPAVWQKLKSQIPSSRRTQLSLLWGVSVAAAAAVLFLVFSNITTVESKHALDLDNHLFDSGREQFSHSNVL